MCLYGREWHAAVQSGFQPEAVADLLGLSGASTFRVGVEMESLPITPVESSGAATILPRFHLLPSAPLDLLEPFGGGLRLTAELREPLCIGAAIGRRILEIVGSQTEHSQTSSEAWLASVSARNSLLSLVLPDVASGQSYDLVTSYDMKERHQIRGRLLDLRHSDRKGFLVKRLSFRTVGQMLALAELIQQQAVFNELLQNTFRSASVSPALDEAESISLQALLSGESFIAI